MLTVFVCDKELKSRVCPVLFYLKPLKFLRFPAHDPDCTHYELYNLDHVQEI